MSYTLSRVCLAILFSLMAVCSLSVAWAQGRDDTTLVVPFSQAPPLMRITPDAAHEGFAADLVEIIAERLGFTVEYRDFVTTGEFIGAFTSGEADIFAGIARLPPLAETFLFSDPVASETLRFVVLEENAAAFEGGVVEGRTIGVVPPALGSGERAVLDVNTVVEFESGQAAVMGLLTRQVEALLIPNPIAYSITQSAGTAGRIRFVGEPLRVTERVIAVHRDRSELLAPINEIIAELEADGTLAALRRTHLINIPAPPPDRLTVAIVDLPPYGIIAADGTVSGFAADVFRDLAERADLRFDFVPVTLDAYFDAIETSDQDILPMVVNSDELGGKGYTTIPFQSLDFHLWAQADAGDIDWENDPALRVGVVSDSAAPLETLGFGADQITVIDDVDTLLSALLRGEVDLVFEADYTIEGYAQTADISDEIRAIPDSRQTIENVVFLRHGLSSIRDRLDAVLPGYLLSEGYQARVDAYFGTPIFWTRQRLALALAVTGALVLISLGVFVVMSTRARIVAKAAAELAVVHDELESIFNATSSGVVAFDKSGTIIRVNDRARHILGGISAPTPFSWPKAITFLDAETMRPLEASADPMRRALSGNSLNSETHLLRRVQEGDDHRYVRVDTTRVDNPDSTIQTVFVIDDVSQEERNRQVVERKSRLDALGQLTGGIAHDFNNLLASQLYAIDLAGKAKSEDQLNMFLKTAANSIQRGRSLTARLLAFARRQTGLAASKSTDVVFEEFQTLVRPMLEAQIDFAIQQDTQDLRVFCDQTQLETALMNLVLNARDAILRAGKGNRIDLSARPVQSLQRDTPNGAKAATEDDGKSFRYVEITVADNGPGMNEETLARCTDPFFTTKESNSGTGLGLAMVYGFVRQSDGYLRVYSEVGIGTTVQLTLPRGTDQGGREAAMPEEAAIAGNGQRILVVEDELQLLIMMTEVLEDLGYKVISAKSGQDALNIVESGQALDMLITDVVMPGTIGGFDLAEKVRDLQPDLPVLYTSGYTGFTATEMGKVQAPLLQKPTPTADLARAIARALAGRSDIPPAS